MITGQITAEREAVLTLRLRSADGVELDIEAVLDTGFSDALTLPLAIITALELPRQDFIPIRLADGSQKRVAVYEDRIRWDGVWREIPIQESESTPLVGMALLYQHLVSLEVVAGGNVTIEPLE